MDTQRRFTSFPQPLQLLAVLALATCVVQAQPDLRITSTSLAQWPAVRMNFRVVCDGDPTGGYTSLNLAVKEDGVLQPSFIFTPPAPARLRLSLGLVFDGSGSGTPSWTDGEKAFGNAIVDSMDGVHDEAAMIIFNSLVSVWQSMTVDRTLLHSSINSLTKSGASANWDGFYYGVLETLNNGVNPRRAVIAMADGPDNSSTHTPAQVISLALANGIRVYTIGLSPSAPIAELQSIATSTGGTYTQVDDPSGMTQAAAQVFTKVSQTYTDASLEYTSGCSDGSRRTVQLSVSSVCAGSDSANVSITVPLDTSTFTPVSFAVGTTAITCGRDTLAPIELQSSVQGNFEPFTTILSFDTSKLRCLGIETPAGTILQGAPLTTTAFAGGLTIHSLSRVSFAGPGVLAYARFGTAHAQTASIIPVGLTSWIFDRGCYSPRLADGSVDVPACPVLRASIACGQSLPFGTREIRADTVRVLVIANDGTAPLPVVSVSIPGPVGAFTVLPPVPSAIAPGDSAELSIRFLPMQPGVYSGALRIEFGDIPDPVCRYPLSGTGILTTQRIEVSPTALEFDTVTRGSSGARNLTIVNTGVANLKVTGLAVSGLNAGDFSASLLPGGVTIAPSDSFRTAVTFAPLDSGERNAVLTVLSDDPWQPSLDVPLSGRGRSRATRLLASPSPMQFDSIPPGAARVTSLIMKNAGDMPLSVSGFNIHGGDADQFTVDSTARFTIASGDSAGIAVRFAPLTPGSKSSELAFVTNDTAWSGRTIPLLGRCIAAGKSMTLAPTSIDYGMRVVGSPVVQSILATNTGNVDLTIAACAIEGSGKAVFQLEASYANTLVPRGGSVTIGVRFSPVTFGPAEAVIRITLSDSTAGVPLVPLHGIGLVSGPRIVLSDSLADFGSVFAGQDSVRGVVVTNWGNASLTITATRLLSDSANVFSVLRAASASIPPGARDTIRIRFAPGGNGSFSALLSVLSNDALSLDARVRLHGNGRKDAPAISVLPDRIAFARIAPRANEDQPVVISNHGVAALHVSSFVVSGADTGDFLVTKGPVSVILPGVSDTTVLSFSPLDLGWKHAILVIDSDDPLLPSDSIPLDGLCADTDAPRLAMDRASMDFGTVLVGESKEERIRCLNRGGLPLRIDLLHLTGPDSARFTFLPTSVDSLATGIEAEIAVRFTPVDGTAVSALLRLSSNDPLAAILDVPLTGQGVITGTEGLAAAATSPVIGENYPNPVSSATSIGFYLPQRTMIEIAVCDLMGHRVATLARYFADAGPHVVHWNGRDDTGAPVRSGLYFYHLLAGSKILTRKLAVVR